MSRAPMMYDDCYLVMNEYGIQRMTKRPGQLKRGEVSVKVRLSVPRNVFTAPAMQAQITIPEDAVRPAPVDVQVMAHEESEEN